MIRGILNVTQLQPGSILTSYLDIPLISIFSSVWLPCTEKAIYMMSFSEWFRISYFWDGGKKFMLVQKLTVLLRKVRGFAYMISDPQFLHRKYTTLNNYNGQGRGKRLNEGKNHDKKITWLTLKDNQPTESILCKGLDFSHWRGLARPLVWHRDLLYRNFSFVPSVYVDTIVNCHS